MDEAVKNFESLKQNSYPGRGIVLGLNKSGSLAVQIYWIMGRSENSRNRIFVRTGDIVKTEPFDTSKISDPSLIIYNALLVSINGIHAVSNGDQTDTIINSLDNNGTFEEAIKSRTYEPDAPNFTPRISGITTLQPFSNTLSIIKRGVDGKSQFDFFEVEPTQGIGFCIHTYKNDGDPLPSFEGEPHPVPIPETIDEIANTYWEVLNPENRVSLVVKTIDLATEKTDYKLINKLH